VPGWTRRIRHRTFWPDALWKDLGGGSKASQGGMKTQDAMAEGGLHTHHTAGKKILRPEKITPIYRSDSSGTTDNFQKYLTAAAPDAWTKGAGKEFQGGAGEGAQKSAGVVQAVQATPGSIGYVEIAYALQNKMTFGAIKNASGNWVKGSIAGVTEAGASVKAAPS